MRDALATDGAVGFLDAPVVGYVDVRTGTRAFHVPDVHILHLVANLHAAHALDALGHVADQGEALGPVGLFDFSLIGLL